MIVRARIVIPISQAPLADGAVLISDNRIVGVDQWKNVKSRWTGKVLDLGDSVLLPGLINAHCHLDYTDMAGQITRQKNFPDWIKAMVALKANWSYAEYAKSWINGAKMLVQSGTTTVGDIEAVPELLPEVWSATPLRVFSFLEMTGVKSGRSPADITADALKQIQETDCSRNRIALSPHALYSTMPDLLKLSAEISKEKQLPITTHLAESREEFEMYLYRRGPLFDWLKTQRVTTDCGSVSPVQQLERCNLLSPRLLAVHVNYLVHGDAQRLAETKTNVIHCPRSHKYFQHQPFPFAELDNAGVNICLGTDSLASMAHSRTDPAELNMFSEMRSFRAANSGVEPKRILQMATRNCAKALGMAGQIGEIANNSFADMIALPFSGSVSEAEEAIIHFSGRPSMVMIDGLAIPE